MQCMYHHYVYELPVALPHHRWARQGASWHLSQAKARLGRSRRSATSLGFREEEFCADRHDCRR